MRVFLIGFMGVGQTTLGERLAKRLGLTFVDLDHAIEEATSRTVACIFDEEGEAGFRHHESTHLDLLLERQNVVVATGGGTPTIPGSMDKMLESGTVIWLQASVETILHRVQNDVKRPLLAGLTASQQRRTIEAILAQRMSLYQRADFIVDTEGRDPRWLVENICERLQLEKGSQ